MVCRNHDKEHGMRSCAGWNECGQLGLTKTRYMYSGPNMLIVSTELPPRVSFQTMILKKQISLNKLIQTFFLSLKAPDKLSLLLTCLTLDLKQAEHAGITFKWILNQLPLLLYLCKVQLLAKSNADWLCNSVFTLGEVQTNYSVCPSTKGKRVLYFQ